MWYKRIIKITVAIFLLVLLLAGLVSHPPGKVSASNFPPAAQLPPIYGTPGEDYVPDQIIVKFKEGVLSLASSQLNQNMGATVVRTSPHAGFKVLHLPAGKTVAEMVALYSQQSIVQYAEPNYIRRITWSPNDPAYSYQWHFEQIDLEGAWDQDTTSPNYGGDPCIVVAVIDTGVAYETYGSYVQASDLASTNFWTNSSETAGNATDDDSNGYVDDIHGWDFINSDAHPNDDNWHGTHVTGTIAQSTNNGTGVAGIAFNTTIMPIKVLDADGNGTDAQVADGIYYAADNGAEIINMSLGGAGSSDTLQNAVAYASNAGVTIIAAMGNDGNTVINYPAGYNDYVIAVGATRYDQTRPSYGSYGSHMDIAAPGGDLTVNQNGDAYVDGVLQQTFATEKDPSTFSYPFFQGTSMATPHVAGVAALILAKNPAWTPAQVRHTLQSTAADTGSEGRDDEYGWGLLDASSAVGASLPPATSYKGGYTTEWNDFSDYNTEHTVYMKSTGLLPGYNYRVAYYDGNNDKRATEDDSSDTSGNLLTQHTFVAGTDADGTWHVIVSDAAHTPPSTYSSTWVYTITSDTFTVAESAIPEFPTFIGAAFAFSLSVMLYFWLRRRRAFGQT